MSYYPQQSPPPAYPAAASHPDHPPPPQQKPLDTPPPPNVAPTNVATATVNVRLAFLRKVYFLLTINLLITIGFSVAAGFIVPIRDFVVDNRFILLGSAILSIALLLVLACVKLAFPANLIIMFCFVTSFSVTIASIVAFYFEAGYGVVVLQAFCATAAVFLSITLFILITKKDFSFLRGALMAGFVALIVLFLLNFLVSWTSSKLGRWTRFAYSALGALLMIGYLLYDTSLIVNRLGPDDWLIAVISLYVDVTNLFLFFLQLFSFAQ